MRVTKLNFIQVNVLKNHIFSNFSLDNLRENEDYERVKKELLQSFGFDMLNTFSFCRDGFLGLLLELNKSGKIAICKGESEALIRGGEVFESLGFELVWINLQKDGKVNLEDIKNNKFDYLFLSSYIMDTFMRTDLKSVRDLTGAKIISNASANFSQISDAIYLDNYKLSGFSTSGVLMFREGFMREKELGFTDSLAVFLAHEGQKNQKFNTSVKEIFLQEIKTTFGDDLFFFVDPHECLEFTLHFGLKNIKARELIRSLALEEIFITNGEGCALGLFQPSRVIEQMNCGFDNKNAISLSFMGEFNENQIKNIVQILYKKYRRIRALNG